LTAHSLYVGNGTSAPTALGVATDGQLVIGSTGADPALATLTAGAGISITNASGSITITNSSTAFAFVNQTATAVTMAPMTGYICTSTANALVTLTLPAIAAVGDTYRIIGKTTGGWTLQAAAGQVVNVGSVATTTAGTVSSSQAFDSVEIVCITANTAFSIISGVSADFTIA
jgi:hypothetical protein